MNITLEIVRSWKNTEGSVNTLEDIKKWIDSRYFDLKVNIKKIDFSYNGFWYYDEKDGYIRNKNNSFFQLAGYQEIENDMIVNEQPVIIQNEIGYLGIICKKINGTLNFLMQAKIEPGNINKIQISPTIQATKSNFTRKHGGNTPPYLDYFINSSDYEIVVDQIQSEQGSRFYKKRNRNIILLLEEKEIEVLESHKWMTLGQIKQLMSVDNLVNMDSRTVLSCIPFSKDNCTNEEISEIRSCFQDKTLYYSIFENASESVFFQMLNKLNDHKMYRKEHSRLVPLKSLKSWQMGKKEISCRAPYDFKIVYCYIEIEGREVTYWEQPLLEANGTAVFGMFTCVENGVRKFMVRIKPEIGCFDSAEIGPIVQLEPTNPRNNLNAIERLFFNKLEKKEGIIIDVMLSEEGGRFYHEQNRNVIIDIKREEISELLPEFFWVDFSILNRMVQFNNNLNIQLRNLLSLLDLRK